jgi:hypothetical protein
MKTTMKKSKTPARHGPDLTGLTPDERAAVVAMLLFLERAADPNVVGDYASGLCFGRGWSLARREAACERLAARRVFLRQAGEEFDPDGASPGAGGRVWYTFEPSLFEQGGLASERSRGRLIAAVAGDMPPALKVSLMTKGALSLGFMIAD